MDGIFSREQAEQKRWEHTLKLAELIKGLDDLASSMDFLAEDQGWDRDNADIVHESAASLGPILAIMVAQEDDENE